VSSITQDTSCSKCKSSNAYTEQFNDDETGEITQCFDCNYIECYRKEIGSGKVVEDYQGYNHYYLDDDVTKDRRGVK